MPAVAGSGLGVVTRGVCGCQVMFGGKDSRLTRLVKDGRVVGMSGKSISERLAKYVAGVPRFGAPFPVGGLAAVAEAVGCSRAYVHMWLTEHRPGLLVRHRGYSGRHRVLCSRCGKRGA